MRMVDKLLMVLPRHGGWPYDITAAKSMGLLSFTWMDSPWSKTPVCVSLTRHEIVTREQYETALAASSQVAWSGEGLPPTGCECEFQDFSDSPWKKVRVIHYSDDEVWLKPLNGGESFVLENPDGFRPIRTEAERKREEAIDAIANLCHRGDPGDDATAIYNAITAGEIPGLRLE